MLIMLGIATYTDLRWRIIPDKLVMVGLVYFLVLRLLYADHPYYNYLLGIAAGAGLLYAFALYCPRAFGGGDIKLMAVVGVGFGWQWTLLILLLTLLAIIVYALGILLMKGRRRRRVIPMAPFFLLIVFLLNYMMM
ncbi:A24 family peptidase [Paenibacillus polymyxa]|nr:A24 family peptidase [Paenibacillus polymyxa]MDY8116808.1 A24 family peptidase [Paenibacillus polymyxa]